MADSVPRLEVGEELSSREILSGYQQIGCIVTMSEHVVVIAKEAHSNETGVTAVCWVTEDIPNNLPSTELSKRKVAKLRESSVWLRPADA